MVRFRDERSRVWLRFVGAVAAFVVLVAVSSAVGVPHDAHGREALPAVALDWRLLFHIQRAGAMLAAIGVVLLVAWRGAHGDWPVKFGQVEYAPKEAVAVTADALAKQDRRLQLLEATAGLLDTTPIESE